MNKVRSVLVFAIAILTGAPALAQQPGFLDVLREHLSIRQSLRDKNTINEPAFVALTMPDEGPDVNTVAVAATALLYPASANRRFNVGAAMQFNQNSAAAARQNVFTGGGEAEYRMRAGDPATSFFFPRLRGIAGYKRNGEKHTAGFTTNAYLTYEMNRPDDDSSSIPIGNGVIEFTPQVGVEFENVLSAESVGDEGKLTRTLFAVKVNSYPFGVRLRDRFIVSLDLAYRRTFQTDFDVEDRNEPYALFSIAATLDPFKIFSVSLDRVMGEDPTQDFSGPDFWRMMFKVQFTRPQKRAIIRFLQLQQQII